jgi:hypothetical protein
MMVEVCVLDKLSQPPALHSISYLRWLAYTWGIQQGLPAGLSRGLAGRTGQGWLEMLANSPGWPD